MSRLPFSFIDIRQLATSHLTLGGLAGRLSLESLLAANINLDLLRLGLGLFGKGNLQHSLVRVRVHLSRIHGTGQRERASEASVLPLDATEVLLFLFLLNLALAVHGEGIVVDAELQASE
jgi:hypothetical protein